MAPEDPLVHWLSFVHPAVVTVGLLLAVLSLSSGLRIRGRRRRRQRREKVDWQKHLRLSQPAVIVLIVGFALGPLTSVLIRKWALMDTLHGWVGLGAVVLYAVLGLIGLRLKSGRRSQLRLHGNLGLLAVALSAVAAITGIELLP